MFTAAALCGLAVEGKIDLDAPIGKVVAGLPPGLADQTGAAVPPELRDAGGR